MPGNLDTSSTPRTLEDVRSPRAATSTAGLENNAPGGAHPEITIPPVGTIITNDGVEIKYEKYGLHSGPVVVLIHGWSGSRHYWDMNTRQISRQCVVITYDLRHHGESGKPTWVSLRLYYIF